MTHEALKRTVYEANRALVQAGLVVLTWGNASAADRAAGVMAIKPSGVDYARMSWQDMVLVSLETGQVVEGNLRPSSDSATHLEFYRAFEGVCGAVHTHSRCATAFAQACREIPCLGTTHADCFYGPVPITRPLTQPEVEQDYEANTGRVIVGHFQEQCLDPLDVPAVLVACHGPFVWGATVEKALENAIVLEEVAQIAALAMQLRPDAAPIAPYLLDKHFLRKHGSSAYYGQTG